MYSKVITRILPVAGMTGLLVAVSLAGLAVGRATGEPVAEVSTSHFVVTAASSPATQAERGASPAALTNGGCDATCVDDTCVALPADQLSPIQINDNFIIYPTSACLCGDETIPTRMEGEGEFFLPNIETDQGTDGIYVKFVLDWPSLEPQCVQFTGTWEEGVPIGASGFLLTSMEGEATFEPEPAVHVSGTIESALQAPNAAGPAVMGEGTLWISLEEPYDVSFEGNVEMFNNRSVQATMTLDQSWGFAGSAMVTGPICEGPAFLHVWEEEGVYGASGSATLICEIPAGSLTPENWSDQLPTIPSEEITVEAESELGEFCLDSHEGECTQNTYGVWAGATPDLSLPENLVEPGVVVARFFISSTGILSATTNLERCEETNRAMEDMQALFCPNQAPTITLTSPGASEESGSGSYIIGWTASDPDDDAVVSLYYDRNGTGRDGRLIACCLSEADSRFVWDTSEVGSGTYYVYGRIDDGKNLPEVSYSAGTVKVVDHTPPAAPSALSLSLQAEEMELSWEVNPEEDVVGYRVYFGPKPGGYVRSYNVGNLTHFRMPRVPRGRPQPPRGNSIVEAVHGRQPPAQPKLATFIAVTAYDSSGNESSPSEELRLWSVYLPAVLRPR